MTESGQALPETQRRRRRRRRRRSKSATAGAAPLLSPGSATEPVSSTGTAAAPAPPFPAPKAPAAPSPVAGRAQPVPVSDRRVRVRTAVMSYLARHPETQVASVLDAVRGSGGADRGDETVALEVLHELLTANVLMDAVDRSRLGFPWLRLTDYGQQVLRQGKPVTFDPDQYLSAAQAQLGNLPPLALDVLREAVATYHRGFVRSSALLLGTASEIVMNELIDAYIAAQSDKERQRLQAAVEDRGMYARYRLFREEFDRARETRRLPDAVSKDIEAIIDLIFNAIRLNRNEAGHPSAAPLNPVLVATTLQAFLQYAERLGRLTAHYREQAGAPPAAGPKPARRRTRRGGRRRKPTTTA